MLGSIWWIASSAKEKARGGEYCIAGTLTMKVVIKNSGKTKGVVTVSRNQGE